MVITFLIPQVQQSLEKIAKLEQEKEHWMLEAQLAKIKLEKENKKVSEKAKTSVGNQLIEATTEKSFVLNAVEQEKDDGAEKALREPVQSTSLVSVLLATEVVKYRIFSWMFIMKQWIVLLKRVWVPNLKNVEDQKRRKNVKGQ